ASSSVASVDAKSSIVAGPLNGTLPSLRRPTRTAALPPAESGDGVTDTTVGDRSMNAGATITGVAETAVLLPISDSPIALLPFTSASRKKLFASVTCGYLNLYFSV